MSINQECIRIEAMKVALFIPCYVDQFYPQVAVATLELLEKLGVQVEYPLKQTCCGQPMANSGYENDSIAVYRKFVSNFSKYDHIICPSGSCVYHVQNHFNIMEQNEEVQRTRANTVELVRFLTHTLKVKELPISFPYKVGLHLSCHGQRGLHQANASEITPNKDGEIIRLLKTIKDIHFTELDRNDECCGFGGSFCISEESVSARMGIDRLNDHLKNGTHVLTAGDMSCLMHLDGIVKRQKLPIRIMHLAEILNGNILKNGTKKTN